jgi:hypothetical protein
LVLALVQIVPELAVLRAVLFLLGDEHAVVLAADFLEGVAERAEEILIRRDDRTIEVELDDGLRLVQRIECGLRLGRSAREHAGVSCLGRTANAAIDRG